jgi:hypothetical protein
MGKSCGLAAITGESVGGDGHEEKLEGKRFNFQVTMIDSTENMKIF